MTDSPGFASDRLGATRWLAHDSETVAWMSSGHRGTREDRMLREVRVSLPPYIAGLMFVPRSTRELDRAVREIAELEKTTADVIAPLGRFLIRIESVASSKIELMEATTQDYARALGGVRSNPAAVSMVAAAEAITRLVESAAETITSTDILNAHRLLMRDDPSERGYAGRLRDVQNWIGGSDYSPREAMYVPPPADKVPGLMNDLLTFANRSDIHPVAQAALVHAQFESIHPFADGNGRIGRALINAVMRRSGVSRRVVVPVASALGAGQDHYFGLLTKYRTGDADAIVDDLALCVQVSAREAAKTAQVFRELPPLWHESLPARRGSTVAAVIDNLVGSPVMTADQVERMTGVDASNAYRAMARLEEAGIVHEVTARKRKQVWAATAILDELDDLNLRIATAIRLEREH